MCVINNGRRDTMVLRDLMSDYGQGFLESLENACQWTGIPKKWTIKILDWKTQNGTVN